MAVLRNVKVIWASIQAPNTKFEHEWSVDAIVTEEQAKELQAAAKKVNPKGIKFGKTDDGAILFSVKRKVNKFNGDENKAPVCVGTEKGIDGRLLPVTDLVGNGSLCNVQYNMYEWDNQFGKGVGLDFKGLQVLELVSYGAQDGDEFDSDEESSPEAPGKDDFDDFDDDI